QGAPLSYHLRPFFLCSRVYMPLCPAGQWPALPPVPLLVYGRTHNGPPHPRQGHSCHKTHAGLLGIGTVRPWRQGTASFVSPSFFCPQWSTQRGWHIRPLSRPL